MKHLRQVDEERGRNLGPPPGEDAADGAQPKQSAFQIAVSVAHAADSKVTNIHTVAMQTRTHLDI